MSTREIWFSAVADLLINLAAAWFAAALVSPYLPGSEVSPRSIVLLANIGLGIFALITAVRLRRLTYNHD